MSCYQAGPAASCGCLRLEMEKPWGFAQQSSIFRAVPLRVDLDEALIHSKAFDRVGTRAAGAHFLSPADEPSVGSVLTG